MSISVDIRGIPEVKHALDQLGGPPMKRTLQKASTAGAKALKPHVKAAAPKYRRLQRSISSRQARKDRPAAVVSARPSVAFYRHFVILGTRRGVTANPFIARGYARGEADALAAINRVLDEYVASL